MQTPYFVSGNDTKELKSGGVNELFTSGISELPPVGGCGVSDILRMSHNMRLGDPRKDRLCRCRSCELGGWRVEGRGGEGRERSAPGALSVGYCVCIKELKGREKEMFSMYGCRL